MATPQTANSITAAQLGAELAYTEAMIRLDQEKRLAEVQAELMKWMLIGAFIVQAVVFVALIKLLP